MSTVNTYDVVGMTCDHCVRAVTHEVGKLSGVRSVDIALIAGGTSTVTVTSDRAHRSGRLGRSRRRGRLRPRLTRHPAPRSDAWGAIAPHASDLCVWIRAGGRAAVAGGDERPATTGRSRARAGGRAAVAGGDERPATSGGLGFGPVVGRAAVKRRRTVGCRRRWLRCERRAAPEPRNNQPGCPRWAGFEARCARTSTSGCGSVWHELAAPANPVTPVAGATLSGAAAEPFRGEWCRS